MACSLPRFSALRPNPSLVEGAISTLTLVVYFVLSFATGAWHITWLVFLIGVAVGNVVDAAFAIGEGRDDDED